MTKKPPKKFVEKKDSKNELEILIQAKINSQYSMLIPVKDDTVIFIEDPVKKLNRKFKLESEEIDVFLTEMCNHGLMSKLDKDFQEVSKYSMNYLNKWKQFQKTYVEKNVK